MNRLIGAVAALATILLITPAAIVQPPEQEFLDAGRQTCPELERAGPVLGQVDAYNETTGYNPGFVSPSSWTMRLNGCASTSLYRITGYTFTITQVGTTWTQTHDTKACSLDLHTLPAQGQYSLKLVLHTDKGQAPGVSTPVNRNAEIHRHHRAMRVLNNNFLSGHEGMRDRGRARGQDLRAT